MTLISSAVQFAAFEHIWPFVKRTLETTPCRIGTGASEHDDIRHGILTVLQRLTLLKQTSAHRTEIVEMVRSVIAQDHERNAILALRFLYQLVRQTYDQWQDSATSIMVMVTELYGKVKELITSVFENTSSLIPYEPSALPTSSMIPAVSGEGATQIQAAHSFRVLVETQMLTMFFQQHHPLPIALVLDMFRAIPPPIERVRTALASADRPLSYTLLSQLVHKQIPAQLDRQLEREISNCWQIVRSQQWTDYLALYRCTWTTLMQVRDGIEPHLSEIARVSTLLCSLSLPGSPYRRFMVELLRSVFNTSARASVIALMPNLLDWPALVGHNRHAATDMNRLAITLNLFDLIREICLGERQRTIDQHRQLAAEMKTTPEIQQQLKDLESHRQMILKCEAQVDQIDSYLSVVSLTLSFCVLLFAVASIVVPCILGLARFIASASTSPDANPAADS